MSRNDFNAEIEKLTSRSEKDTEGSIIMTRYARRAVDEIFKGEIVRINAFMISATKKKMAIADKMLDGLLLIEGKLFSADRLEKTNETMELLKLFTDLVDKVVLLLGTIENTKATIDQLNENLPKWDDPKVFVEDLNKGGLSPETRKRVSLIVNVLIGGASKIRDELVEKNITSKPVIDVGGTVKSKESS